MQMRGCMSRVRRLFFSRCQCHIVDVFWIRIIVSMIARNCSIFLISSSRCTWYTDPQNNSFSFASLAFVRCLDLDSKCSWLQPVWQCRAHRVLLCLGQSCTPTRTQLQRRNRHRIVGREGDWQSYSQRTTTHFAEGRSVRVAHEGTRSKCGQQRHATER